MGEPTHEVVKQANGVTKNYVKMIIGVIVSVGTIITAGWVGWVSAKNVDHERRVSIIESSYEIIKEDVKEAKVTITQSAKDLVGMQVLMQDIRDDQIRRQRKEK